MQLEIVCFSRRKNNPASTKLFSKGSVFPRSGCQGLLGFTEQQYQRRETHRSPGHPFIQRTLAERVPSQALLGARTREESRVSCLRTLGPQGAVLRGWEGGNAISPPRVTLDPNTRPASGPSTPAGLAAGFQETGKQVKIVSRELGQHRKALQTR